MSSPFDAETRDRIALRLLPGLGPRLTAALLERFGSAGDILRASATELQDVPHIGPKLARELIDALGSLDVDAELDLMTRHDVGVCLCGQAGYPTLLTEIHDPPPVLYQRGRLQPRDENAVAVVGTRHPTAYGKRTAERLAGGLARAGYTVVSGLARGLDGVAHRAALAAGGRTVAVVAGGLSRVYPPEHAELAGQVAEAGAVLTESPMRREPMAELFPARNRIISGMSRAVLVIEASEKSGTLITARHAAEQGRTLLAVPGPIDSETSGGTNALLREGAVLVRHIDDILEELDGVKTPTAVAAEPVPELDETQTAVWTMLADGPRHLDEMVQKLAVPVPAMSGVLMMMEMRKLLRRLPGNRYERR